MFVCCVQGEADALKKSQAMSQSGRGDARLKVITLAGTVIHKSGNLTGGTSGKGDGSAKLRAASDKSASKTAISEKEFTKLQQRHEELTKQTIDLEAEMAMAFRQQDEEQALASKVSHTLLCCALRSALVSLSFFFPAHSLSVCRVVFVRSCRPRIASSTLRSTWPLRPRSWRRMRRSSRYDARIKRDGESERN